MIHVEDKEVGKVLFYLDRFAVSDEFYHELSMIHSSLPRSYLVKQARTRMNAAVNIKRLPKPYFGCYRSFGECRSSTITREIEKGAVLSSPVEVKISGDGAPFSRLFSIILISFSLPSLTTGLSSSGMF